MLTRKEYNDLWTQLPPNGFGNLNPPPNYHDYARREIYKQDYLDLFKGEVTYERIDGSVNIITGIENEVVSDVNEYPWTRKQLEEKRKIKYIMIGEAPPPPNIPIINECGGDKENTFFYNYIHIKQTAWLTQPFEALIGGWTRINCPKDKKSRLIELANMGYFLIDLIPFSTKYTSTSRNHIVISGMHLVLFEQVVNEINILDANGILNKGKNGVKIAFSGPLIIHHELASAIGPPPHAYLPVGVTLETFANALVPAPPHYHVISRGRVEWPIGSVLSINPHLVRGNMSEMPEYKCCAYNPRKGSMHPPISLFIKNAFDL